MPVILSKQLQDCVGGGGGGRPNMAQAGGKNPAGIAGCIEKGRRGTCRATCIGISCEFHQKFLQFLSEKTVDVR